MLPVAGHPTQTRGRGRRFPLNPGEIERLIRPCEMCTTARVIAVEC